MPDSEITILIQAIDKATETMKSIEGTIANSNKKIIETNQKATNSFQNQISTLIAVGNAASSVDRIFDSYSNLQLRLENAQERVNGATDRLAEAQYKLKKVMADSASTSEDVQEAQRGVESASRALTIAHNNQQRANNQVIGTYIQMGVGMAQLIQTIPTLVKWYKESETVTKAWATATAVLNALKNPLYLGITLAAAAAAAYSINAMLAKDAVDEFNIANGVIVSNSAGVQNAIQSEADKYKQLALAARIAASGIIEKWNAEKAAEEWRQKNAAGKTTRQDMQPSFVMSPSDIAGMQAVIFDDLAERISKEQAKNQTIKTSQTYLVNGTYYSEGAYKNLGKKQNDFISRPGQAPVSFSKDDTIIGMKDLGDLSALNPRGNVTYEININGNNYGTDPDEMATALIDKLRRKISI